MKKLKQVVSLILGICMILIPFGTQNINVEAAQVPNVNYQSKVQKIGWQKAVKNGAVAGTIGKSLSIESLKINLSNLPVAGGVAYKAQVQRYGWQKSVANNQIAGAAEAGLRLEGIRIVLTGEISNQYDIYYRALVQNNGWLEWTKNGGASGSSGKGLRMEAIEIKLIKKGQPAPKVGRAFIEAWLQGVEYKMVVEEQTLPDNIATHYQYRVDLGGRKELRSDVYEDGTRPNPEEMRKLEAAAKAHNTYVDIIRVYGGNKPHKVTVKKAIVYWYKATNPKDKRYTKPY